MVHIPATQVSIKCVLWTNTTIIQTDCARQQISDGDQVVVVSHGIGIPTPLVRTTADGQCITRDGSQIEERNSKMASQCWFINGEIDCEEIRTSGN